MRLHSEQILDSNMNLVDRKIVKILKTKNLLSKMISSPMIIKLLIIQEKKKKTALEHHLWLGIMQWLLH